MIRLLSPDGKSVAEINPVGAALSELYFEGNQIAGSPDMYSGVTLFPWPNRIYGGVWNFSGADLQLPINDTNQNSSLHGLVYDQQFELTQSNSTMCEQSYRLMPSAGYPFELEVSVRYLLKNLDLEISHIVENLSDENVPFAIGFHPYFKVEDSSRFDSELKAFSIGSVQVDETIGPIEGAVSLTTSKYQLEFSAHDTEYFHVFTNRYSSLEDTWFAIEPQSSPADSFNTGVGLILLRKGESKRFRYKLSWK
jgi:aldose 1-epimerase